MQPPNRERSDSETVRTDLLIMRNFVQ